MRGVAMSPDIIKVLLLYSLAFNYVMLLIWFCVFSFSHDWLYRLHSRWFCISRENFDALHYVGMAFYKIGLILLNIAPLVALCLVF